MQRFHALCQRYAGWIVITLVLLLCQRWWISRHKPERLLVVPEGYVFKNIRNGIITLEKSVQPSFQQKMTQVRRAGSSRMIPVITTQPMPATPALFAMPVTGGPLHALPLGSIEAAPPDTMFMSGEDTYHAEYHKTSRLVGIPLGYGGSFSGVGTGSSAPPPPPKPPFHTVTNREEASGLTATLRHVSASGNLEADSITFSMGYLVSRLLPSTTIRSWFKSKIAFSGDAVYWVKGFPDEVTYRVSSNKQYVGPSVVKRRSAIMTMPLHGGTRRQLLDHVAEDTMLLASEDGVLCQVSRNGRVEWLLVRSDGTFHQVRTDASPYYPPVECNHCLYWSKSDSVGSSSLRIMQANTDGSNPHVLYTVSNAGSIETKGMARTRLFSLCGRSSARTIGVGVQVHAVSRQSGAPLRHGATVCAAGQHRADAVR